MNKKLPNFLLVGAPKAGTTSLYQYLSQHPDIFLSQVKEPYFLCFANEVFVDKHNITPSMITSFSEYKKLFQDAPNNNIIGEATTFYLYYYEKTINNIKKYLPNHENIKIIISLRDPVQRAFSQYKFNKRNFKENLSFPEALIKEEERINNNEHFAFHYCHTGFYYEQVKAYVENFKDTKIILYDDIKRDSQKTIKDLLKFLNVDDGFPINTKRVYNISGMHRSKVLHKLTYGDYFLKRLMEKLLPKNVRQEMTRISSRINTQETSIDKPSEDKLKKVYFEEIRKLSNLIDRDLTNWL